MEDNDYSGDIRDEIMLHSQLERRDNGGVEDDDDDDDDSDVIVRSRRYRRPSAKARDDRSWS